MKFFAQIATLLFVGLAATVTIAAPTPGPDESCPEVVDDEGAIKSVFEMDISTTEKICSCTSGSAMFDGSLAALTVPSMRHKILWKCDTYNDLHSAWMSMYFQTSAE
ncbi:hypothetical protein C8R43DRAFT_958777 [Mycena crocata]|nr:hypothetical protein C8R43DRAFT_958777 [Mycena crocata]